MILIGDESPLWRRVFVEVEEVGVPAVRNGITVNHISRIQPEIEN
jgi:hypothetical protein